MSSHPVGIDYTIETEQNVYVTIQHLTKELSARGFGVLSNIDVRKIIMEKLGESMGPYVILDVCNPKYAKRALDAHKEVGLILPCKIAVFEDKEKNWISLYRPTQAVKVLGHMDLDPLALEVEIELKQAIDSTAGQER